jgi:hypothetical protein
MQVNALFVAGSIPGSSTKNWLVSALKGPHAEAASRAAAYGTAG